MVRRPVLTMSSQSGGKSKKLSHGLSGGVHVGDALSRAPPSPKKMSRRQSMSRALSSSKEEEEEVDIELPLEEEGAHDPCQQPYTRVTHRALCFASEPDTRDVDVTAQCCVKLEGEFIGTSVMVSCKLEGQFSLQWEKVEGHFPAGQSNVYHISDAHGKPELEFIIRGLTRQHKQVVAKAEDSVGAKLVHSLLVANNERSVNLAIELFKITPRLLLGTHGQHSPNKLLFKGEGSMHIVAVNKRLAAAETMVRTAVRHLTPAQVLEMLSQSCTGLFFGSAPMRYFGGSVMSYLAVFGLLIPVLPLLESLPDERKTALACRGKKYHKYTALHAVVMAGRVPEFDALIKYGCDEFAMDADGYSPMRLSVKMGMRDIFLHSLRHRVKTEWVWGPIAAYKLPLEGLDTEGRAGELSVMELTAESHALENTKEMLLDTFMNGAGLASQTQSAGVRFAPAFSRTPGVARFRLQPLPRKVDTVRQRELPPPPLLHCCRPFAPALHLPPQVGPLLLGPAARSRLVAGLYPHGAGVAINLWSRWV